MEKKFWHERWQKNEIGFHQREINTYLESCWDKLQIKAGATIFVPLCGKSHDMLWLLAEGYKVIGIEISQMGVEDFFTENDLEAKVSDAGKFKCYETEELTLLCGDFFDLSASDLSSVTAVYDRASLIALPPEMRQRYTQQLVKILPQKPETLLITMEYPAHEMQGPPFTVTEKEVSDLFGNHYQIDRLSNHNVLKENPQFIKRGLTSMSEKAYRLS
jgi:thiopurine S-methyltransferase